MICLHHLNFIKMNSEVPDTFEWVAEYLINQLNWSLPYSCTAILGHDLMWVKNTDRKQHPHRRFLLPGISLVSQQTCAATADNLMFPAWGPVTVHTHIHTAFIPANRPSHSKTHSHSKNTNVYPQQWSLVCGCEAPPKMEEAEETSAAVC